MKKINWWFFRVLLMILVCLCSIIACDSKSLNIAEGGKNTEIGITMWVHPDYGSYLPGTIFLYNEKSETEQTLSAIVGPDWYKKFLENPDDWLIENSYDYKKEVKVRSWFIEAGIEGSIDIIKFKIEPDILRTDKIEIYEKSGKEFKLKEIGARYNFNLWAHDKPFLYKDFIKKLYTIKGNEKGKFVLLTHTRHVTSGRYIATFNRHIKADLKNKMESININGFIKDNQFIIEATANTPFPYRWELVYMQLPLIE